MNLCYASLAAGGQQVHCTGDSAVAGGPLFCRWPAAAERFLKHCAHVGRGASRRQHHHHSAEQGAHSHAAGVLDRKCMGCRFLPQYLEFETITEVSSQSSGLNVSQVI